MSISSSEGSTVQTYLEWLFNIPWNKKTKDDLDKFYKWLDKKDIE